jgi:UDP-3-O-[3-hydroxymyristoyl] glucosamine N-acyltransferase
MLKNRHSQGVTLAEITSLVKGELIGGDPTRLVLGLCSLEEPKAKHLAFSRKPDISATAQALMDAGLAGVLVRADSRACRELVLSRIIVPDPLSALVSLVPLFFEEEKAFQGIHPQACIEPTARIGKNVTVGPFSYIGRDAVLQDGVVIHAQVTIYPGVTIGAGSEIYSGVSIREFCEIGPDCVIHNGSVIGADGFGYFPDPRQGLAKVPQAGTVKICAGVEIGANSCIDRATLGTTIIGTGTKIDNIVQVGHNVQVGSHSILCGGVMIGGSCNIGSGVTIGGATSMKDHTTVVDGCRVGGNAGVSEDLLTKADYVGFPPRKAYTWRREMWALTQLPALLKKLGFKPEGENES